MGNPLSRAYFIVKRDGFGSLIRKGIQYVQDPIPSRNTFYFRWLEYSDRKIESETMMITLRKSTFDSDTLSLLIAAASHADIETVHIAVNSIKDFNNAHKEISEHISGLNVNMSVVEMDTKPFVQALHRTSLVFLKNKNHMLNYQLIDNNPDRYFIRIFHGFAKAVGDFREATTDGARPMSKPKWIYNIDLYSVSSDLELFYRSAAKNIPPEQLEKCGFPKYDRLRELEHNTNAAILSESTRKTLSEDNSRRRILYAPTHKGNYDKTALFPFSSFDLTTLREELRQLDATLYIRMHIHEENAGVYDEYIDGDLIKYAGQQFSPSVTEILPFFDALITDYSSIYTEYLALDRPLLFVIDETNPYWTNKGLAFDDEVYVPGPKIESFEEFSSELEDALQSRDYYSEERNVAIKAILPDRGNTFIECILSHTIYNSE